MKFDDFRNIDVRNPASWPFSVKIAGIVLICAAIVGAGYVLFIQDEIDYYKQQVAKEETLRKSYLEKKAMAINLPAYKQQMEEMERTFGVLLRQLPNTTEVPNLLVDITQAGLGRGLDFVLFKPEREKPADFYAELPVSLRVSGTYHELGQFVSDVAALPRIVTFGDVAIAGTGKSDRLSVSAVLRTYRYLEPNELAAAKGGKAKTAGGAKAGQK